MTTNALGQARSIGTIATNATYHPSGSLKAHSYGNGFTYSQAITSDGLPENAVDKKGSDIAISHAFTYDKNKNLTALTNNQNGAYTLGMDYDGLDRLKTITDSKNGTGFLTYDAMGNITRYKLGSKDTYYNYPDKHRLTYTYGGHNLNFSYDALGNVISRKNNTSNVTTNFDYNEAGNLVSASTSSNTFAFKYDGHNRRVKYTSNGQTDYSMYSQAGQLMFRQTNNTNELYYYLGNKLVGQKKGGTLEYVHTDFLGSASAYTSTTGSINKRLNYQPFGETFNGDGSVVNKDAKDDAGYTGHKFDKELGLNYMQARYYDPVIGRFYSNDPVGALRHLSGGQGVHGFNRYAYVSNNPYKYIDPDGRIGKLLNFFVKLYKNGGNPRKAGKEFVADAMESGSTLVDTNASILEKGEAIFNLVSPVGTKDLKLSIGNATVDPKTLSTNRQGLDKSRLATQEKLVSEGTPRQTKIVVNTAGQVIDGNHGVKAASKYDGQKVDVKVIDDGTGNKVGERLVKDLSTHGN